MANSLLVPLRSTRAVAGCTTYVGRPTPEYWHSAKDEFYVEVYYYPELNKICPIRTIRAGCRDLCFKWSLELWHKLCATGSVPHIDYMNKFEKDINYIQFFLNIFYLFFIIFSFCCCADIILYTFHLIIIYMEIY